MTRGKMLPMHYGDFPVRAALAHCRVCHHAFALKVAGAEFECSDVAQCRRNIAADEREREYLESLAR